MNMEIWIVMADRDLEARNGSVHHWHFTSEPSARAGAANLARQYPGTRYALLRVVDSCEASISPAEWAVGVEPITVPIPSPDRLNSESSE